MFGFIHRLYIQHPSDDDNPLVHLQLSFPYKETGVFKSGKSYMIRSKTKPGCASQYYDLRRKENIIPNTSDPTPFHVVYGVYSIGDHKKWYSHALQGYILSLGHKYDDAFYYITDTDKKIAYLEDKLRHIRSDWRSLLSTTVILL